MVKNLLFLSIIVLICGCSSPKETIISDALDAIPVITGSVPNPSAFVKGGVLVLDTFKPGTGAVADDETDQLSSMMIKGIKETLPEENSHFTFPADNQDGPDCLLDGHIEDYRRQGHFSHLSVDGQIWLRDSGEKIFLFQTSIKINLKTQNPNTVAYQIGVSIAHFIGSHGQPIVGMGWKGTS